MREIENHQFTKAEKHFPEMKSDPVLNGVLEGNNPGLIFISQGSSDYSIVWAKNEQVYFFGGEAPSNFHEIKDLFENRIFKEALENEEEYFQTSLKSPEWEKFYFQNFSDYLPFSVRKKVYRANKHKVYRNHNWRNSIPEFMTVDSIDETAFNEIDDGEGRLFKKWWYDYASFLDKGTGTCVYVNGKAVSCCFSCFAGAGSYEIGAVTLPEFRRKGLCSLAANLFVEKSFSKGVHPRWTCSENNTASVKTALRSGFEEVETVDYHIFSLIECNRYFDAAWFNSCVNKNHPAAVDYLERGMEIEKPDSKRFHIFCAKVYAAAGKINEAKKHLYVLSYREELEKDDILFDEFSESGLADFFFPE